MRNIDLLDQAIFVRDELGNVEHNLPQKALILVLCSLPKIPTVANSNSRRVVSGAARGESKGEKEPRSDENVNTRA